MFRNWLVLRGIGVDISVFDSMALLIATAALGLLLVGPSLGVAATVPILGSRGVAQTAAAGALLTATGAVGAMLFAPGRCTTAGARATVPPRSHDELCSFASTAVLGELVTERRCDRRG